MEKNVQGEKGRETRSRSSSSEIATDRASRGGIRLDSAADTDPFLSIGTGTAAGDDHEDDDVVAAASGAHQKHQHHVAGLETKAPSPPLSSTTITGSSSGGTPSVAVPHSSTLSGGGSGGGSPGRDSHQQLLGVSSGSGSPERDYYHQAASPSPGRQGPPPSTLSSSHQRSRSASLPHPAGSGTTRYPLAIKLLVSNNVAGSIIGRQGQTISELQSRSLTRIKLSQSGDYFPGTHDRVCLVQGEPENIKTALRLLLERMFQLHEQECLQHRQPIYGGWPPQGHQDQPGLGAIPDIHGNLPYNQKQQSSQSQQQSFDFVVRLLVPTSCCGMIIGKAGSNIKFLEESSGVASVRLSPKENISIPHETMTAGAPAQGSSSSSATERVVAITGRTLNNCLNCVFMVFEGMVSHPDVSRYSNMTTSYARRQSPPLMVPMPSQQIPQLMGQHLQPEFPPPQGPGTVPPQTIPFHEIPQPQQPSVPMGGYGRTPTLPLSAHGKLENLPRRVLSSPDLYGSFRHHRESEHKAQSQLQGQSSRSMPPPTISEGAGYFAPSPTFGFAVGFGSSVAETSIPHSVSAPDLLAFQFDQLRVSPAFQHSQDDSISEASSRPLPVPNPAPSTSLMLVPPIFVGPDAFQAQVAIPDSVIGAILGRAGRTLTELQLRSGTRMWISQRGEYVPGTRNRIVTIRGSTAHAVWQAELLIGQRVGMSPVSAVGGGPDSLP